ncbi:hypothetical protein [Dinghuibacter silviterrae]|uniref:Uncharacterized protein n=1 Tax=Dinghuibacter silviterrae TaxID=1539049 RepID=A0A4R8DHT7_9BACT|nr:hypothetical protein [Dinghuibacter silviterrae]TDW97105.1 hypothetical protein EDB95_4946 [Dinghuibacter silviterrae]
MNLRHDHKAMSLEDNKALLRNNGFDSSLVVQPAKRNIQEKLQVKYDQVVKDAHLSKQPESFYLKTKGRFGPGKDPLFFNMHFKYYPDRASLELRTILVKMGEIGKILFLTHPSDMRTVQQFYEWVSGEKKIKAARELTQQEARPVPPLKNSRKL